MGKRFTAVHPVFTWVRQARGVVGVVFFAAMLLGCSGKSESSGDGGAGDNGADSAGRPSSSGGRAPGSLGGDEGTEGPAGRGSGGANGGHNGGVIGTAGGGASGGVSGTAGGSIISGAGRAGALGHAGSSGGGSLADTSLGLACTSDAQCGDGMICATADGTLFGAGGPSHGMCTKSCSVLGTECDTLKAGAECINFGTDAVPHGFCLDACEQNTPVDLQTKCAGRSDFVCVDLGQGTVMPFCVPHCRSDAECGSGLFCDKSGVLGLCSKTKPPAGDPVGTPCTPGAATNTCEGYCIRTSADQATPVTGACVELCSGGFECMYSSGSSASPGGFCGGSLSDPFGALDLGYCLASCSCTGDCKLPGDLCRKWSAMEADPATALGAPGVCYPELAGSVELTCGVGGAGGGGAGGGGAGTPPQTAGASGSGL